MPALDGAPPVFGFRSGCAQDLYARRSGGSPKVLIERGKGKSATLREFQVSRSAAWQSVDGQRVLAEGPGGPNFEHAVTRDAAMFNATKLLGELMESRSAPSAAGRLHSALGQNRHGSGGLQSLLGGLNTGGFGGRAGTSSGANAGVGGLLGQLASSAQQAMGTAGREVRSNNPMAIGGLGALAGALMGGGKGAIGGGVMAVLGSLAYSALQNSGQGEAAAAATAPKTSEEVEANARLLLRAMISAAKADGQIDRKEMDRIMGKLREAGSDPEAQQFVLQEMSGPLDIEALAREVNSPHLAAEVYAASLLAIEVDTPAERQYLDDLARALKLPPQTTGYVRQQLGVGA